MTSLQRRGRFAVPAMTQMKRCSSLLPPLPPKAVKEDSAQTPPQPPALDRHSGKRRMKPSSQPGPLRQVYPSRADPGATGQIPRQPQTAGGRTRWDESPTTLSSELLSHAAVNMWWLFPCLLLAGRQPCSGNFSGKCDE